MSHFKFLTISCICISALTFQGCSKPADQKTSSTDTTTESVATGSNTKTGSGTKSGSNTKAVAPETPEPPAQTSATQPFGEIAKIPGVVEAENFDKGEPGVAYSDVEPENQGADDHRETTQVDIEKRDDASGGYGVGWTRKDEWLVYTVNVEQEGSYKIEIPVASDKQGGTFHLEFNGEDVTGPIQVPDTGGWGTLQTISATGVQLKAGQQTMKIVMDTEGPSGSIGDIDQLKFSLEEK